MKNLLYFEEVAYFSIDETINSAVFSQPLPKDFPRKWRALF